MQTNQIEPGLPVTIIRGKDKQAGHVEAVTPDAVIVKRDKALRLDANGPSRKQRYGFAKDPYGERVRFKRQRGRKPLVSTHADGIILGVRQEYVSYKN